MAQHHIRECSVIQVQAKTISTLQHLNIQWVLRFLIMTQDVQTMTQDGYSRDIITVSMVTSLRQLRKKSSMRVENG